MPEPYSADLRERVLWACERGRLSRAKIAAVFQVAESTVYRWLQTWRAEGRCEAKPHAGGPAPRLDQAARETLAAMIGSADHPSRRAAGSACRGVAEANDLSLAEYAAKLLERAGVTASGPTVCRALQKLGLRRKKDAAGGRAGPARYRRGPDGLAGRTGQHRAAAADLP